MAMKLTVAGLSSVLCLVEWLRLVRVVCDRRTLRCFPLRSESDGGNVSDQDASAAMDEEMRRKFCTMWVGCEEIESKRLLYYHRETLQISFDHIPDPVQYKQEMQRRPQHAKHASTASSTSSALQSADLLFAQEQLAERKTRLLAAHRNSQILASAFQESPADDSQPPTNSAAAASASAGSAIGRVASPALTLPTDNIEEAFAAPFKRGCRRPALRLSLSVLTHCPLAGIGSALCSAQGEAASLMKASWRPWR